MALGWLDPESQTPQGFYDPPTLYLHISFSFAFMLAPLFQTGFLHIVSEHFQAHNAQLHYQRGTEGLTLYSPIQKTRN